jgi:hypothetical protein
MTERELMRAIKGDVEQHLKKCPGVKVTNCGNRLVISFPLWERALDIYVVLSDKGAFWSNYTVRVKGRYELADPRSLPRLVRLIKRLWRANS